MKAWMRNSGATFAAVLAAAVTLPSKASPLPQEPPVHASYVSGGIGEGEAQRLQAQERDYSLLGELNARPRTTYMSALRNPNPEIKS